MKASPDFPTRRSLLVGAAVGSAALALPRRGRGAAPPPRRIGFALVGIGKLTQKQLIRIIDALYRSAATGRDVKLA